MPNTIIYTKIGLRKGSPKLWCEGGKLSRSGIQPGDRFSLSSEGQAVKLVFHPDGTHTVSSRKQGAGIVPIINVCGGELKPHFQPEDRVRVSIKDGCIEVTLHHFQRSQDRREANILERLEKGLPLRMGSLAHGGGVLDYALHQGLSDAGVSSTLSFANEIEESYLEASMANNPVWSNESLAIQAPMQEVEWTQVARACAVDVLLAGLPCTGASLSGRAKNRLKAAEEHAGAGALFVAFLNAIQALKPAVVILENVPQYQTTTSMTVIRSVLTELGYCVQESILNGADFGALEHRSRMCMVAVSSGLKVPELSSLTPTGAAPTRLQDVLDPVAEDDPTWKSYSYLEEKQARDKEAGKGFRRQLLTADATSVGTIGRGYNKARSTEPFLSHPSGDGRSRLFTPAEHARIKTIPDRLIQGVSNTVAHEILGQSVIGNAFRAVGCWLGASLMENIQSDPLQAAA